RVRSPMDGELRRTSRSGGKHGRHMDRQFPIGKFQRPTVPLDSATRSALIHDLERMPADLRAIVGRASDAHLQTPYRTGGWTVRQVVHHVPESHMNAYV